MDRVAQLLSKKMSKRHEAKNKLVLSKLLEELNSLSVFLSFWSKTQFQNLIRLPLIPRLTKNSPTKILPLF